MPAVPSYGFVRTLEAREWRDTVGQSGMTPTAFSFLIPVFVVAIVAPFLCIFCIRRKRRAVPVTAARPILTKTKKPALRRAEAREKLNEVTELVNVAETTSVPPRDGVENDDGKPEAVETRSVLERECAICLSTLHAPAPPEPAKLSPEAPITDAAALPTSLLQSDSTEPADTTINTALEPETILKLSVCGHEFHADCLVSWFVLRKTSCPICRSTYMSEEAMEQYDEEERIALGGDVTPAVLEAGTATQPPAQPVSNWRYFLHGSGIWRNQEARAQAQTQTQAQSAVEMQSRTPGTGEQAGDAVSVGAVPVETAVSQPDQPSRPRWRRLLRL